MVIVALDDDINLVFRSLHSCFENLAKTSSIEPPEDRKVNKFLTINFTCRMHSTVQIENEIVGKRKETTSYFDCVL